MIRSSQTHVASRPLRGVGAILLVLSLAACAPEPVKVTGMPTKGVESPNSESSWSEPTEEFDPSVKSTELPESFPQDAFPLPAAAVIDDAGARGDTAWFLVLRASDPVIAEQQWQEIVSMGAFSESEATETSDGGRTATLTSTALVVTALTLPQADGSVLLSFDLTATGV